MSRLDIEQIRKWADEHCNENGLFVVKIECVGAKITIYADALENITIEQCGKLSRYVQNKLDESSSVLNDYSFDVSSPGMSNSLVLPIQYKKRLNKNLKITLEDGRELEGNVVEVDDEKVTIEERIPKNKKTKEEEKIIHHTYPYIQIKKAIIPLPTNFKKK